MQQTHSVTRVFRRWWV